jgi:membrane-associated phospholipid phosphatase
LAEGAARQPAISRDGGRWLASWALVAAVVSVTLLVFCGYHAGFDRVNAFAVGAPSWVWEGLTVLGDERVAFALTLFLSRRHPRIFWTLITAALLAIAYTQGLKPLVSALRPPGVLDTDAFNLIGPGHRKGSFPSGHTATAAVFFGVLVYYGTSAWFRSALILVAVAAGLSRVAVGVHWPVDVAAGMVGGTLSAWVGVFLVRKSEWGIFDPSVHLAFVTLAAAAAFTLLYWDGGYSDAAVVQQGIGAAALGFALFVYLIRPTWIWLRRMAG